MRSVMITTSLIPASIASTAASFAYGAGTNKIDAFACRRRTASRTLSKTGTPSTLVPALPGVTPATTFVPKSRIARVWNWPWWPVMPWTTTRAFFVRRTATSGASRLHLHREIGRFFDRLGGLRADRPQDLLRGRLVHTLDPRNDRDVRVHLVDRLLHARRDRVGLRDASEDVHEDDGRTRLEQEFESLFDLRRIVRPAEVEEHAAPSALQAQGIERGHRQPRAVRDPPEVPVELDEDDGLVVGRPFQRCRVLVYAPVFGIAGLAAVVA